MIPLSEKAAAAHISAPHWAVRIEWAAQSYFAHRSLMRTPLAAIAEAEMLFAEQYHINPGDLMSIHAERIDLGTEIP